MHILRYKVQSFFGSKRLKAENLAHHARHGWHCRARAFFCASQCMNARGTSLSPREWNKQFPDKKLNSGDAWLYEAWVVGSRSLDSLGRCG